MPTVYETHNDTMSVDKDGTVTRTRTFRYNGEDPTQRAGFAVGGIAINRFDPFPGDSSCLAVSVNSNPLSDELGWWEVSYEFTNKPFDRGTTDPSGDPGKTDPSAIANPTARTPVVTWGTNSRTVPFTKDYDPAGRKAVENSAKQPFEGQEVEDFTGTISVSFNLAGVVDIPLKQTTYLNKINDADFGVIPGLSTYPQYTLKCNAWNGTFQLEAGYGWYTSIVVELEYKWDKWTREILDAGYYERKAAGGGVYRQEKILNTATGMPVDAPVKLKNGLVKPDADADVYLTFWPYKPADFTNIFNA